MIDLGAWATGTYRIRAEDPPDDAEAENPAPRDD